MIRRIELDFLRSVRLFSKKSPYKLFMGGSFAAMALLNAPRADCAKLDKDNNSSSASASYFGFFPDGKGK